MSAHLAISLALAAGLVARAPADAPAEERTSQTPGQPAPEGNPAQTPTQTPVEAPAQTPAPPVLSPIPPTLEMPLDPDDPPNAFFELPERSYRVRRFVLSYKRPHPDLPPIAELESLPVRLGLTRDGYVGPRPGVPEVTVRVGDVFGGRESRGSIFFETAIQQFSLAIVNELRRRELIGLFVVPDARDIDDFTRDDLRLDAEEERPDLRLEVWTGVVRDVRTVAAGERVGENEPRINNPIHDRLRRSSPLRVGGLLRKDKLDNYAVRLNRQPGRRVDVAIGPTSEPGEVVLDYLVSESKPWSLYAQLSNTGTDQTNVWRQRVGFVHNQLSNNDDTLRLDYVTSAFKEVNALNAGYDRPFGDTGLTWRLYGGWNEYTASDVGLAGEAFTGNGFTIGSELSALVLQKREWFFDWFAGGRFDGIAVNNQAVLQEGSATLFSAYTGLRVSRETDAMTTRAALTFEALAPFVTGLQQERLNDLGRLNPDGSWSILKWEAEHSFYLEPLLNGHLNAILPADADASPNMTLAHELAISTRGQYAFDKRLVANAQQVAGGVYSVRGYPESIAAGDSVFLATAEYRFHLPRLFKIRDPNQTPLFGRPFRYSPQQPYGRADWDLIFRAFVDAGQTINSQRESFEQDVTLLSVGLGVEFQFQQNLSLRIDWGSPLKPVEQGDTKIEVGDSRLHFILTLLY